VFVEEIEGTERLSRHMVDAINHKVLSLKKQGRKEKKINLEYDTLKKNNPAVTMAVLDQCLAIWHYPLKLRGTGLPSRSSG